MARQKLPTNAAVEYDEQEPLPAVSAAGPPGVRRALPQGAQVTFDDVPVPAPEPPQVSKLESLGRGAAQGATLGFSDEVVGLAHSLFAPKGYEGQAYRQHRDESREKNRAAKEANPLTYGAGELGGSVASSFVPGLGVARGVGVVKAGLQAAKVGAISGLGHSEAEDVGSMARDAALSGAISGLTGGVVSKVMGGAPQRAVQRRLGDVTGGATATMRDRVVGKAGEKVDDTLSVLREKPFRKAGDNAGRLLEATDEAIEETSQRFSQAVGGGAPVKVTDVIRKVDGIAEKLSKDPGKADLSRAVRAKVDDIRNAWLPKGPDGAPATDLAASVGPAEVQRLASDIAEAAFRGSPAVAPKQGQAVSREVWGALKELIDESLDKTAAGSSKEARALGRRLNTLMNMREAVRYKATREATESTRLKDVMGKSADLALLAYDPVTFAGKKGLEILGKPLARAADDRLADIVNRAAAGEPMAKLKERAIMMGLGPVAAEAMATWAIRTYNQVHGGYQASESPAAP